MNLERWMSVSRFAGQLERGVKALNPRRLYRFYLLARPFKRDTASSLRESKNTTFRMFFDNLLYFYFTATVD